MRNAQSAIEYLTVYGLAITVVVIVVTLLFYLGFFSSASITQDTVTGFSGFGVSQSCINGTLNTTLTNEQSFAIEVTRINSSYPGAPNPSQSAVMQPDQSQLFSLLDSCPTMVGSSQKTYSLSVIITYITGNSLNPGPFFSNGTFAGVVASHH